MKKVQLAVLTAVSTFGIMLSAQATIIVQDSWSDGVRTNRPFAPDNSVWYCDRSAGETLSGRPDVVSPTPGCVIPGVMVGFPRAGGSTLWWNNFTTNSLGDEVSGLGNTNAIELTVGQTLKVTMDIVASNVVSFTAASDALRFGLFNFADGGGRTNRDNNYLNSSSGTTGGTNVTGYMWGVCFMQTFTNDSPVILYVRTNTFLCNNLMSGTPSSGTNFHKLGDGPAGYLNGPAFSNNIAYKFEFLVTRNSGSTDVRSKITGQSLNIDYNVNITDPNYRFHRFDTLAIRPNSSNTVSDSLIFTNYLVEVVNASPSAIPLNIAQSSTNVILSWTDAQFKLQSSSVVTGAYSTISGATSPYTNAVSGDQKYFRLIWP